MTAVLTTHLRRVPSPCKAVGQDAALQVGSEFLLHPKGNAIAQGAGLGGLSEVRLQVVLDHGVERRGCGTARPVHGPGRRPVGDLGRRVPESVSWAPIGEGGHGGVCLGSLGASMVERANVGSGDLPEPPPGCPTRTTRPYCTTRHRVEPCKSGFDGKARLRSRGASNHELPTPPVLASLTP